MDQRSWSEGPRIHNFSLLRRSDIPPRAIRTGAKVVNEDERVAMGRMHAPSPRPGTSNAARGSTNVRRGMTTGWLVSVFPATVTDGGRQAF
jgi:hypothetical protein